MRWVLTVTASAQRTLVVGQGLTAEADRYSVSVYLGLTAGLADALPVRNHWGQSEASKSRAGGSSPHGGR